MSRHPKSEIRKRRLPDRDQVKYFRLGYTSIFNATSFTDQFLEFWHSLPSSFRDDDDDNLLPTQRRRAALFEQHFNLNEDEFKHNIRALPDELSTDDLITAPPHCLIQQKIRTARKHYENTNNNTESQHPDDEIQLTITDSPRKKKRRLNTAGQRKERKALGHFIVHDSDSENNNDIDAFGVEPQLFGLKLEANTNTNNTNNNSNNSPQRSASNTDINDNTPLLRRLRGRPIHSQGDSTATATATATSHSKKRKRLRLRKRDGNRKERTNDRQHVLFASNVEMPFYDQLSVAFVQFQERRKEFKTTHSKKEVNSVTKLTRNHRLHCIEQDYGCKLMRENECILNVAIFHSNKSSERFTKSHEYLILSTQTLADLKDTLYCLSDESPIGRDIKNGYFFIEDTFYDDTRHDDYCRLSRDIIEWSHNDEHWKQTGVYLDDDMQSTMIKDLNIRLGTHYLYVHQGDCQHVIVFTECRISTKTDCNNCYAYPMPAYRQILKRQKCGVCEMYPAKYVTYGDKLTTHNPFFFCQRCYYPFHYDKNGKLLYDDFQVFDYIHD